MGPEGRGPDRLPHGEGRRSLTAGDPHRRPPRSRRADPHRHDLRRRRRRVAGLGCPRPRLEALNALRQPLRRARPPPVRIPRSAHREDHARRHRAVTRRAHRRARRQPPHGQQVPDHPRRDPRARDQDTRPAAQPRSRGHHAARALRPQPVRLLLTRGNRAARRRRRFRPDRTIFLTAAFTGLRMGELIALR